MRYVIVIVLAVLLLAAAPSNEVNASENSTFHKWALRTSEELDSRWARISGSKAPSAALDRSTSLPDGTVVGAVGLGSRGKSARHGWSISGSTFIHKGQLDFLPNSTRLRNSPARGSKPLQRPAQATLGIPHKYRRPLYSKVRKTTFLGSRKDFIRPRLQSTRRISKNGRYRRGVSRPRYRADRPKRFR